MTRHFLFRLHRWITLVFSLPLAIMLVTGLVLSFEPIVATDAIVPGAVTAQSLDSLLARYDPAGKARGLVLRSYDGAAGSLTLTGVRETPLVIDLATGAEKSDVGPLAQVFATSRRLHEHLMVDLDWLVSTTTVAMLGLIIIGIAMGLPRLNGSVSGWHKGIAWFGLPLVVLSPLTGLCLAFGVTLAPLPPARGPAAAPLSMREAVGIVAASHDPSRLIWLRQRGRTQLARVNVDGEYQVFAVRPSGLHPAARNWPRLIHEGNWAGVWSGGVNAVTSLGLLGLFGTGLFMWARRQIRRRHPRSSAGVAPPPAALTSPSVDR